MRLEKHQVTQVAVGVIGAMRIAGVEEVVKAHLKQVSHAGVTGDVAAQFAIGLVGAYHHGEGVPTHERRQALLYGEVAGKDRLLIDADGVDVGGVQLRGPTDLLLSGRGRQRIQNKARALWSVRLNQCIERLSPFLGFIGVDVPRCQRVCGTQTVGEHVCDVVVSHLLSLEVFGQNLISK